MLAYLEGVLDATDAKELGHKIEESEFAASLMHRTRDVTRRLKLGAPKLDGRGLASDPNTVAEYLDNTLAAERVPEFETICLESDVHLAEVASVHQILALVLGAQAEFDPKMRRRMYKMVEEADAVEAELAAPRAAQHAVAVAPHKPAKPRRRPEVPDYLRQAVGRRNYVPLVLAAAVLVCAAAAALLIIDFSGSGTPVADRGQSKGVAQTDDSKAGEPAGATTVDPTRKQGDAAIAPVPDVANGEAGTRTDGTANQEATEEGGLMPDDRGVPPIDIPGATPAESVPADPAGTPAGADVMPLTDDEPQPPPADASIPGSTPAGPRSPFDNVPEEFRTDLPPLPGEGAAPMPAGRPTALDDPALRPGAATPGAVGTGRDMPAKGTAPAALDDPALKPAGEEPAPAAEVAGQIVGRLTNDSEILLRPDGAENAWVRLSTRDALAGGNELIALPTYRPSISFNTPGGATAQLLGGTVAKLLPPDANGVPGLQIIAGQVVLLTAGRPGTQLHIKIGDKDFLATFVDPDSTLAFEVRRLFPDGGDPARDEARTTAEMYVASGMIDIGPLAGGKHETFKVPDRKTLMGIPATDPMVSSANATLPAWIVGTTPNQTEKRATLEVEKILTAGETVRVPLEELSHDRRTEYRNLAVLCMTTLGDFSGFLPVLNDPLQKANWNGQIEAARRAIARNQATAKSLKATLESQRDAKKADDLYRMLCGFSRQDYLGGADARLVGELDNEEMDFRVLSFWNLRQVLIGTLNYHPEHNTAKQRAVGVRAWKLRLEAHQIVPKS